MERQSCLQAAITDSASRSLSGRAALDGAAITAWLQRGVVPATVVRRRLGRSPSGSLIRQSCLRRRSRNTACAASPAELPLRGRRSRDDCRVASTATVSGQRLGAQPGGASPTTVPGQWSEACSPGCRAAELQFIAAITVCTPASGGRAPLAGGDHVRLPPGASRATVTRRRLRARPGALLQPSSLDGGLGARSSGCLPAELPLAAITDASPASEGRAASRRRSLRLPSPGRLGGCRYDHRLTTAVRGRRTVEPPFPSRGAYIRPSSRDGGWKTPHCWGGGPRGIPRVPTRPFGASSEIRFFEAECLGHADVGRDRIPELAA